MYQKFNPRVSTFHVFFFAPSPRRAPLTLFQLQGLHAHHKTVQSSKQESYMALNHSRKTKLRLIAMKQEEKKSLPDSTRWKETNVNELGC
ncbi:unnamed protein product [Lathyrus oleraceus]